MKAKRTLIQDESDNVVANVWSSARMLEFDFAGIEQVLMGWLMRDPQYIRIAKLGVHANLASHVLKRPASMSWTDAHLATYFKEIKSAEPVIYDRSKRCCHGTAYGLTTFGMCRNFPQTFPNVKAAEAIQKVYFELAPGVPRFHAVVRHQAHTTHFLGGAGDYHYAPANLKVTGHPYQYKHWFWSVVAYDRLSESQRLWRMKRGMSMLDFNNIWYGVTLGEDAKRAVAFYPQSTARGVLTEAAFPLFTPDSPDYIGDIYYGATPLRAPIHDSLLLEVPTRKVDLVIERVAKCMQAPILALPCPPEWGIGPHLIINVEAKVGADWAAMEKVSLPAAPVAGVAADTPTTPAEDADELEQAELETRLVG